MATTALEIPQSAQLEHIEQSASMMEQLATAQIQSRYMIALRRPRNIEAVRQEMLRECSRPSFCLPDPSKHGSSLAIYAVPRGKVQDANGNWVNNIIRGASIRFAEMAARCWRNLSVDVVPIGEDKSQRICQVTCTDYETNNVGSQIVVVPKTVEKSKNPDGLPVLSHRTNSYGKAVYTLEATEEETAMNAQRLISKARRNLILQCIPGWLIEECQNQVRQTAADKDAEDPDAARRRIFDAFASVGVSASQLTEYIGHDNRLTPAEMEDLRGFFSGIREGVTTWKDVVDAKGESADADGTAAKIEAAFAELEMTTAQIRNIKGKHVGESKKLLAYLETQVAKKRNDGSKKAETKPEPAKEADTTTQSTAQPTSGGQVAGTQGQSSQSGSTGTAKPGPVAVESKPAQQSFEPAPEAPNLDEW